MLGVAVAATPTLGAAYVWTGTTTDAWGNSTKWSPAGTPSAIDDVATIDATTTGNVKLDGLYTIGSLVSRATTLETTPTAFDVTKGLTMATSTGTPTINASGDVFYYAGLNGTQGFTKLGAGKFTFRFNNNDQAYTGNINISAGILGINQNGSLGDVNNDITIGNGARLLAEPGSNTGTITLPSTRSFTLAGLQSQVGAGNANVTLVIEGNIGESASGNGLVITDLGKVQLSGTVSYTGETRLAGGTLALSGPALLPSANNLRFNGGANAILDLGGASQTVRTVVMEGSASPLRRITNGSFTINGDANQVIAGRNTQTFDFAGLNSLTFNRSTRNFVVNTVGTASVTTITDFNLAKTGVGTNTITATQIQFGGGDSVGNNGNTVRVHLGNTNTFNAGTFIVGGFNAGGIVDFQSGLSSPTLKLRGADGTSTMTTFTIGETSSGSRRGEGVLNLANGSIDALVTDINLGRHVAGANNADSSSLTFAAGSITANTLTLANKTSTGTPTLTASFNQQGGTARINTITFGASAATATPKLLPTYNLTGGTLYAASIDGGTGPAATDSLRTLSINGGTIHNLDASTDLTIDGLDGTASGTLNVVIGASGATFEADANRSITLTSFAPVTGSGLLDKTGAGVLVLNTSTAGSVRVSAGRLAGNGTVGDNAGGDTLQVVSAGTLSPGNSIGTISVGGALDLSGTLAVDASNAGASDFVAVSGSVTIGSGSTLDLLPGSTLNQLLTYTLINGSSITGTFANVDSDILTTHHLDYSSTAVQLAPNPVPEPGAALLGLVGLALRRRR